MTRILPAVLMIVLAWAVTASAQSAADAEPIRRQVRQRHTELRQLQLEQRANTANLINLMQLRVDAAGSGDKAALTAYDQSIADLQADNRANAEQQVKLQQAVRSLNEQLQKIGAAAETGPGPLPPAPEGVAVAPLRAPSSCDGCNGSIEALQKEHRELQRRAERANAARDPAAWRDFEAQRRAVRDLQRQVDECSKQCKPRETTSVWSSPVIGAAAGGAVLAGLLTRGGDDPTLVAPPIANQPQPPTTQPPGQPTTPPVEPAPPTVPGVYDSVECIVLEDTGNQNGTIRLCDFAGGPWEVVVASITIRHASPFVNIEGAPFDATSGEFGGTTRGTVAGVPNVLIAFEGLANAQSGRIAFVYEMGSNGELPGGQPIVYGITLQKRR